MPNAMDVRDMVRKKTMNIVPTKALESNLCCSGLSMASRAFGDRRSKSEVPNATIAAIIITVFETQNRPERAKNASVIGYTSVMRPIRTSGVFKYIIRSGVIIAMTHKAIPLIRSLVATIYYYQRV